MKEIKIVAYGFYPDQIDELQCLFKRITFLVDPKEKLSDIDPDAIVAMTRVALRNKFNKEEIVQCNNLKWIHIPGAGIEEFLFDGIIDCRLIITNGKIIQGPEVSDHAISLLLTLTRRLYYDFTKHRGIDIPCPVELSGKKALVFGAGGIGLLVAEKLNAFGVEVSTINIGYEPLVSFIQRQYLYEEFHKALENKDIFIMAAPLTPKTNKIINHDTLKYFKNGCYLVNVSRGKTMDLEALCDGLDQKIFAGVALDVTDPEPLSKDHKLNSYIDSFVSPHMAGRSDHLKERIWRLITTNIQRFVDQSNLINIVSKKDGY